MTITVINPYHKMKITSLLIILLSLIACNDPFRYLTLEEMEEGVTLQSNNRVFRVIIKVEGTAQCNSKIDLNLNQHSYICPISEELDTIVRLDWYNVPLTFSVDYDSCVTDTPIVGVYFAQSRH